MYFSTAVWLFVSLAVRTTTATPAELAAILTHQLRQPPIQQRPAQAALPVWARAPASAALIQEWVPARLQAQELPTALVRAQAGAERFPAEQQALLLILPIINEKPLHE